MLIDQILTSLRDLTVEKDLGVLNVILRHLYSFHRRLEDAQSKIEVHYLSALLRPRQPYFQTFVLTKYGVVFDELQWNRETGDYATDTEVGVTLQYAALFRHQPTIDAALSLASNLDTAQVLLENRATLYSIIVRYGNVTQYQKILDR